MNFEKIHVFTKGLSFDLEQRAEKANTFQKGINGRLYSSDGVLSFSSIKGSVEIYKNIDVKKYLGGFAFEDQMVLIAKYTNKSNNIEDGSHFEYTIVNQTITWSWNTGNPPSKPGLGLTLSAGLRQETIIDTEIEDNTPDSAIDNSNESCIDQDDNSNTERGRTRNPDLFDTIKKLSKLSSIDIPNYEECLLTQDNTTPQNNKDYSDVIIIITKNHDNTLTSEIVWNGYLNLDINRKINMVGIDENSNYKRVYFTDSLNQLRTFNLKDKGLSYNKPEAFNMVQDTNMLQPEIFEIKENGQLKAMSVQYLYYLITENGQVSAYSPMSELIQIVDDDSNQKFAGGDTDTITNKSIDIRCSILNFLLYDQIECIALEYEINGPPTNIVSLGIKSVQENVYFNHNGTESTISNVAILAEILTSKNSWKYCSDLTIKNNKLIAAGLRNEPYPVSAKYIEDLFLLKGWDKNGRTHDCLINPYPDGYRFIDPANESKLFSIAKTLYTQIIGFGNFRLNLINIGTNESIYKDFINETELYQDFIQEINDWLTSIDLTVKFPNLTVTIDNNSLLFNRTNELILTDLGLYQFQANTSQLIIEFDNQYEFNEDTIDVNELTHGAVSYGYNEGTGIRLSWNVQSDELMTKDIERYDSGYPYSIQAPTLKKGFMKNEIYRLSFTGFKNGNPLFAIPLGDIQAPNMDEEIIYIDSAGKRSTEIFSRDRGSRSPDPEEQKSKHKNQYVEDDKLYAQRVVMKIEVRLGCELKDFIDSYQIQYVERTEENRTILAQGISGPLQRCVKFEDIIASGESVVPDVFRKWTLPYLGGPLHEKWGLEAFDEYGENYDQVWSYQQFIAEKVAKWRYITNRRLMYFDAPDIIYNKVTTNLVEVADASVLGRLKTDHNRETLSDMKIYKYGREYTDKDKDPFENVKDIKTFSRKMYEGGQQYSYKDVFTGSDKEHHPYWLNFSVFSNFNFFSSKHKIIKSANSNIGEIMPSATLEMEHEISNNALTHGDPAMNYSVTWRTGHRTEGKENEIVNNNQYNFCANLSTGYKTLFIKTEDNLFTDELIDLEDIIMECDYKRGTSIQEIDGKKTLKVPTTDTHALINLKLNNEDIVYGGRTKYAFSNNIYIPLSKIIPVHTGTNQAQISTIEGDTYMSLFMRTRTDFHNHLPYDRFEMMIGYGDDDEYIKEYNRPNGWAYAVVLETTIEPRLASNDRHYRDTVPHNFSTEIIEIINSAYYVTNNLKSYIPRPFNFKENPLLMNIIAASKVKLSGEFYDAFSQFLANDFYELEQQYGAISNITTYLDELYVIQSLATNNVVMEPSDTITTDQGRDIQLATGTGAVFYSHKIISKYGTAIRRSFAQGDRGFSFYDETKNEFVKITEPLATKQLIQLNLSDEFENDPVIDAEGWYDNKYKESNINLTTISGVNYTLSYNEALQVFNGRYEYKAGIYVPFNNRIFVPERKLISINNYEEHSLHELNKGNYLNLLGEQKTMILGIIVNNENKGVKIFRGIEALININYPIKSFKIYDNLDINDVRTIDGTHFRYKIREGIHTVPLQNINDREPKRGEWAYIEVEIESINNQKIDLVSLVAFLRDSKI